MGSAGVSVPGGRGQAQVGRGGGTKEEHQSRWAWQSASRKDRSALKGSR